MDNISGILVINKSPGISSRRIGEEIKKLLGLKKVGHAGTLDPMARGVLLLLLEEASKLSQFLSKLDKVYVFEMKLGEKTITGDATGEIVEKMPIPELTEDLIKEVIKKFSGEIFQTPHPFSAIKFKGKPLYKYAREGNLIKLEPRKVEIKDIIFLGYKKDKIEIKVVTSSGVYIRSLAEDIGKELGTVAHLTYLMRLQVGRFSINEAVTLEQFADLVKKNNFGKYIISMVDVLDMKKIKISKQVASLVLKGVPVSQILGEKFELISPNQRFALISENGKKLYAVAEKDTSGRFRYVRVLGGV